MRCPTCRKIIPDGSPHCAYCGGSTRPLLQRKQGGWPFWGVALVTLGALAGGWLIGGIRPTPAPQVIEKVVTQLVEPAGIEKVVTQFVTATPGPDATASAGEIFAIDGMPLVDVPAGDFVMGSADSDVDAQNDEKPQHTVYLNAFWIDLTEVTVAQYQQCVDAGKCVAPSCEGEGSDHPVICVSWQDATNYCAWAGRRLPTEAEWEKAARGTDGRLYPWGKTRASRHLNFSDKNDPAGALDKVADDGYARTAPVGSYRDGASPYGALDMAGNVWEWTNDWYDAAYYADSPGASPTGPAAGDYHVLRGGSWNLAQWNARAADRSGNGPDAKTDSIGFRCALSG